MNLNLTNIHIVHIMIKISRQISNIFGGKKKANQPTKKIKQNKPKKNYNWPHITSLIYPLHQPQFGIHYNLCSTRLWKEFFLFIYNEINSLWYSNGALSVRRGLNISQWRLISVTKSMEPTKPSLFNLMYKYGAVVVMRNREPPAV